MIRVIPNIEIDRLRWDELVQMSSFSNVYAFSWYLDSVCPGWKGLVLNDYEAVLPLPEKRRLGFRYLVQPVFSQQYTICSCRDLTEEELLLFRAEILSYKSIRLCFSKSLFGNEIPRNNFCLDLSNSYDELFSAYAENTKRNVAKAQNAQLLCRESDDVNFALNQLFTLDDKNLYVFQENIIRALVQKSKTEMYVVENGSDCLAVAIFLRMNNTLYYLLPASSDEGKQNSAMFLLLDLVIRKYAQTNTVLDFEGSEIEGVKRFYEGFGAKNVPYYYFEQHSLPLIGKFIKKR